MQISLIVAVSENGAIGKDNQLLWRLPDDLKRFKQLTLGNPMIMGRKTFESIGKPLPGRTSIVVTRNQDYAPEGVVIAHSLESAFEKAKELHADNAFVIGGGELYEQAIPFTDYIYLTRVHTTVEGDTYFELPDLEKWVLTEKIPHEADERHAFGFDFINYARKTDL